jgi:DNA-binding NtrC family response regulator
MTGLPLRVVVVDDDPLTRKLLKAVFASRGYDLTVLNDGRSVLDHVTRYGTDIVIADVKMPCVNGLELLTAIKNLDPLIEVLLLSNKPSVEQVVLAIKQGAIDYLTKPLDRAKLLEFLVQIEEHRALRIHVGALQRQIEDTSQFHGMVGRNPLMLEVFSLIRRLAKHFTTVLVTGETGTGKEMVARALHALSPRAAAPIIPCNCAAITETLAESELFGHERGAFTGAVGTKRGLFEAARGGTIFLDEVSEMPLTLQPKLLRVLESGEIQRVGSPIPIMLDVRVVAATNRGLRDWVKDGRFRQDLYYRLNTIEIHLPPLRDRKDDLPLLCQHFLTALNTRTGQSMKGLSRQAQTALFRHDWPGNVRELARTLEHAVLLAQGNFIGLKDLPPSFQHGPEPSLRPVVAVPPPTLDQAEREQILRALRTAGNNKVRAAELLGISRRSFYRMLYKHSITL